jgi:hypothetical protein
MLVPLLLGLLAITNAQNFESGSESGSGSGSGSEWVAGMEEDDDGVDHPDEMMYNVITHPDVAPETMDGEVNDGGALVSLSNEFVIKDDDSIGTITRPADWYKLITSVDGGETLDSFDSSKQASFKTAVASLLNIDTENIILLVMPGFAQPGDQTGVTDGIKVHVAFAVPVDEYTSPQIEAMVLGPDFKGQLTQTLTEQGITMNDVTVEKILEEVEVASFDMLFKDSSLVDISNVVEVQAQRSSGTARFSKVASVVKTVSITVVGLTAAAFAAIVVMRRLRVRSLDVDLQRFAMGLARREGAELGSLHMWKQSERPEGPASAPGAASQEARDSVADAVSRL